MVLQQLELGYNYRITDLQAALGCSQMGRLDEFVARRTALAAQYHAALADLPLLLPALPAAPDASAWHLFPVQIDASRCAKTRRQVFEQLRQRGIGVNVHYIPVHTQPYYQALGFRSGNFPCSEQYYARAMSLPLFASMSAVEQNLVVQALKDTIA